MLTRHLCTEQDGVMEALHSQTPVVHPNAACKQCKRSICGQLALPIARLGIHAVPQQLLHFPNRLSRHGDVSHMLRRYCPPTSNSALVI